MPTQVWFVQSTGELQVPDALQVCCLVKPEHCVVLGVHSAPHWPAVTEPGVQPPVALQVCGIGPSQSVWFGAQIP